jgi:hypothetical protein
MEPTSMDPESELRSKFKYTGASGRDHLAVVGRTGKELCKTSNFM